MSERRLSPADTVWLYSEWENNPQTVSSLMWLDREIDPEELKAIIKERLVDKYPTFSQRIRKSRNPLLMPKWEDDPDFDLDYHVRVMDLPAPGDKPALEKLVSEQRSVQLDFNRPLWEFYIIQGYEGTTAVHARIQHSIADGWALVRLVLSLADEVDDSERPQTVDKVRPRKRQVAVKLAQPAIDAVDSVTESVKQTIGSAASKAKEIIRDPKSVPAHLASGQEALEETLTLATDRQRFLEFGAQVPDELQSQLEPLAKTADAVAEGSKDAVDFLLAPRPGKTILHGKVGKEKKVAWIEPIPLQPVKDAGRFYSATINDMLVGALTNALRQYLLSHDALTVEELYTTVPVSLRKPDAPLPRTLGNRFGLVPVLLPVGIEDPVAQVREVKRQFDELKASQMPVVSFGLTSLSATFTPDVERLVHKITQAHAIGVTTNVPGPRHPISLAGGVVKGAWGMGGLSGNMDLSFGIFSLAGEINFAVHSDAGLTPDPERILDYFVASVNTLVESAVVAFEN